MLWAGVRNRDDLYKEILRTKVAQLVAESRADKFPKGEWDWLKHQAKDVLKNAITATKKEFEERERRKEDYEKGKRDERKIQETELESEILDEKEIEKGRDKIRKNYEVRVAVRREMDKIDTVLEDLVEPSFDQIYGGVIAVSTLGGRFHLHGHLLWPGRAPCRVYH